MIKNTLNSYGSVSKFLHWIVAFAVIMMFLLGFTMDTFDEPVKSQMYGYHEELGLTIMGLLIVRLYWRWRNPVPQLPAHMPKWQHTLAHLGHYALYILLGVMVLSGWAKSTSSGYTPNFYGLFELPMPFVPLSDTVKYYAKTIHVTTVWILISMISMHILAALVHHFVFKDNVLRRMLPIWRHRERSVAIQKN